VSLFFTALLWLGAAPAWAQVGAVVCDQPVATSTLARHISRADAAFARMNEQEFQTARWDADSALYCLGEPIQLGQAAAFYRMQALGAFVDGEHARAVAWFRSVLAVAPHYQLPEAIAGQGHPLRIDFEVATGTTVLPGDPVRRPSVGVVRIDGHEAVEFPKDRPFVFQHVGEDGRVFISTVVQIGIAPPAVASGRGFQGGAVQKRQNVSKVRRTPRLGVDIPLIAVAGGAAVLSGVSFAVAKAKERRFFDASTPRTELDGLHSQTNTWAWIGVSAGTVAAGTGVAAVIVGTW
jgi:hypothetical protein